MYLTDLETNNYNFAKRNLNNFKNITFKNIMKMMNQCPSVRGTIVTIISTVIIIFTRHLKASLEMRSENTNGPVALCLANCLIFLMSRDVIKQLEVDQMNLVIYAFN